ncbi:MAG TPA: ornithine carbamoyltransferase [Candidatus Limnocylindria bacterium]|nr:ornithine carbamoyltransferase [Candidatus Limnocylindria bacterium]
MPISLKGRSLLTLRDFTPAEIRHLLDLSHDLKRKKRAGEPGSLLRGRNIVLLFEKPSTRTRCAFEAACWDEGGNATYLSNSQMGKKESLEDTARVLGRFYDGIGFRGFEQKTAEDLARFSGVPVWNGLTDLYHPTQALADLMTVEEHTGKPLRDCKVAFVGDARNNVANSLLVICAKLGLRFAAVCPESLSPDPALLQDMRREAALSGGAIEVGQSADGLRGADAVYTDVWVSMGEEDKFAERIALLKDYAVTEDVMRRTDNPRAIFLHCLPSFHDLHTETGRAVHEKFGLPCMEVSDEVFRGPRSRVFDQAENRLHTIKAVMASTIGNL